MKLIPLLMLLAVVAPATADPGARWTQSYEAGYTDDNGAYAGGSEIMHLVAHQGKLYAANGYWKDSRWEKPPHANKQSAQVLRLDVPDGRWQVDLDTGRENHRDLRFMKGNILKSVTFTRDGSGKLLPQPRNLLIMAAGANIGNQGSVSAWVRDDATDTWSHSIVLQGSNANGIRWVPRDIEVHRDKVTGIERLFLLLGNRGIISGVHDPSQPAMIRWDREPEFPGTTPFRTRPLGIVHANGSLLFSVGGTIYKRIDGANPTYAKVLDLGDRTNTDTGGIRGLTSIANPNGPGESILLLWAPVGRSMSQIKRLDPNGRDGYTVHDEARMHDLMSQSLGVMIGTTLGAHNMMYPVTDPTTGETVHLIGFQGIIRNDDRLRSKPGPYYAGAMFAVRTAAQTYTVHEVNGRWSTGKTPLVCPRTFCPSPFGDGQLFVGGHDANGQPSDNMAWIFRAPIDVALGATPKDDVYRPRPNPPTDGLVGTNYTPAYAVNQVQFWHDFRPDVVEQELAAARKYFGISTLRVYLHDINFFQEKEVFLANLERFLVICAKHGIRPGFVFFDGCHRHEGIFLDRPTEPVSGYHNGRWAQSPQARDLDPIHLEKFKPYVQEIIRAHRTDERVLFWEIHNEPPPGDKVRDQLKHAGYAWAKEVRPVQPVLNCEKGKMGWADCTVSDIVDAHVYSHAHGPLRQLSDINPVKGTVITEAGARWKASRRNFGGPIDMVHWLKTRRDQGLSTPGVYLCWELMVGNSNCRWHWIDKPGAPEPEIPWCGLLWPDGTPVSFAESEAVRRYATGMSEAVFFEDFELHHAKAWNTLGSTPTVRNAATLAPDTTMTAGDSAWSDYVLEGRVCIKTGAENTKPGRAGLLFRAHPTDNAPDSLRGYAITFDSKKLALEKIANGRRHELATYDLTTLKTETRINEWSMIRVATHGPRIRVWFNRMHPSVDPERGLRIDFTDKNNPILNGAIGAQTHDCSAMIDDIVVLPPEAPTPSP